MFTSNYSEPKPKRGHGCLWVVIIFVVVYLISCFVVGKKIGAMFSFSDDEVVTLQSNGIYQLDLKGTLVEQGQEENPFASFLAGTPYDQGSVVGLDDLLRNISLAKTDANIRGIYLCGGELQGGVASLKELRDALLDFKRSGKFIYAYADNYAGTNYYLASVADSIYLNPVGTIGWHGVAAQKMYYTRLFQKIGVEMQIVKVGTFKSAVEPYFRTNMSQADRLQTAQYLNGVWNEFLTSVSDSRHIPVVDLNTYADEFMDLQDAQKYISYRLADRLVYPQEMDSIFTRVCGKDYTLYTTSKMNKVERPVLESPKSVAVVYAEGEIFDDGSSNGISGKKLVKTLNKLSKDADIKAVVFRVNSPGGSATASEQIWHAVQVLKQSGKKVVVSMGDYAASGGYYISCGADYIFAQPTTLTGSIGIFGVIPNVRGLRDKIGVDVDGVGSNKNSLLQTNIVLRGMYYPELKLMQDYINRGYDLFTSRCAEGRNISQDSIKRIGEGRVWLGVDAIKLGLVDAFGSINDAVVKSAQLAGLTDYQVTYYPAKKSFIDMLMESLDDSSDEEKLVSQIKSFIKEPRIMTRMETVTIE